MVKVKFCGIRRTEDIEAVNRLKPDLAGFVFAKSKRQVTKEQAAALKELLDPGIKTVAVLVNMPVEEAAALANTGIADLLQLHGDEDAAYIAKLKTLTRAKIIKAIRLRSGGLPVQGNGAEERVYTANAGLLAEAAQADYYLFDTFVADKNVTRTGDQLAHLVFRLIAEGTSDLFVSCHVFIYLIIINERSRRKFRLRQPKHFQVPTNGS